MFADFAKIIVQKSIIIFIIKERLLNKTNNKFQISLTFLNRLVSENCSSEYNYVIILTLEEIYGHKWRVNHFKTRQTSSSVAHVERLYKKY